MESAKWFAVAVGVGHNEDSISMMRSPFESEVDTADTAEE